MLGSTRQMGRARKCPCHLPSPSRTAITRRIRSSRWLSPRSPAHTHRPQPSRLSGSRVAIARMWVSLAARPKPDSPLACPRRCFPGIRDGPRSITCSGKSTATYARPAEIGRCFASAIDGISDWLVSRCEDRKKQQWFCVAGARATLRDHRRLWTAGLALDFCRDPCSLWHLLQSV